MRCSPQLYATNPEMKSRLKKSRRLRDVQTDGHEPVPAGQRQWLWCAPGQPGAQGHLHAHGLARRRRGFGVKDVRVIFCVQRREGDETVRRGRLAVRREG